MVNNIVWFTNKKSNLFINMPIKMKELKKITNGCDYKIVNSKKVYYV